MLENIFIILSEVPVLIGTQCRAGRSSTERRLEGSIYDMQYYVLALPRALARGLIIN